MITLKTAFATSKTDSDLVSQLLPFAFTLPLLLEKLQILFVCISHVCFSIRYLSVLCAYVISRVSIFASSAMSLKLMRIGLYIGVKVVSVFDRNMALIVDSYSKSLIVLGKGI